MGERKVLNKYYPPDFDPAKLPRKRKPKNEQINSRIMLPMSIQCTTCGEYLYRGKKFNARKETVLGEDYLGIKIFRFYMKCTRCSSELTIKTDPKNSDYVCEHGSSRNFEPWREKEKLEEEAKQEREEEEEGDAMKALENKTMDSKTEMDVLDQLDELKTLNARHYDLFDDEADFDALVNSVKKQKTTYSDLTEEDIQLVKSIKFGQAPTNSSTPPPSSSPPPTSSLPPPNSSTLFPKPVAKPKSSSSTISLKVSPNSSKKVSPSLSVKVSPSVSPVASISSQATDILSSENLVKSQRPQEEDEDSDEDILTSSSGFFSNIKKINKL